MRGLQGTCRAIAGEPGTVVCVTDIITLSDARVAAVTERECGEPLVDLRGTPGVFLDARQADPDGSWARLRSGALDRLL